MSGLQRPGAQRFAESTIKGISEARAVVLIACIAAILWQLWTTEAWQRLWGALRCVPLGQLIWLENVSGIMCFSQISGSGLDFFFSSPAASVGSIKDVAFPCSLSLVNSTWLLVGIMFPGIMCPLDRESWCLGICSRLPKCPTG